MSERTFLREEAAELARAKGKLSHYIHRPINSQNAGILMVSFREQVAGNPAYKTVLEVPAESLDTLTREVRRHHGDIPALKIIKDAKQIVENAGVSQNGVHAIDLREALGDRRRLSGGPVLVEPI